MTTRRDFLSTSGSAMGGAWLARLAPFVAGMQACASDAMREGLDFTTFTAREAADFDALAARIVPTDDTPGAHEAGSVYFADHALGTVLSDLLPIIRQGLAQMNERASSALSSDGPFADLSPARRDEIITATETADPGFFFFARTLVLLGLVGDPAYGGNRDAIGWDLLGFETSFRHEPPFGYYDRDEHGEEPGPGADQ
jgi:gluconate 2-dehydrogenase gamma chain